MFDISVETFRQKRYNLAVGKRTRCDRYVKPTVNESFSEECATTNSYSKYFMSSHFSLQFKYDLSYIHFLFFTIYGYITNSQCDQLPVGLIAQLVEHYTGIGCLGCVYNRLSFISLQILIYLFDLILFLIKPPLVMENVLLVAKCQRLAARRFLGRTKTGWDGKSCQWRWCYFMLYFL